MVNNYNIVVVGASGFVGSRLMDVLGRNPKVILTAIVRRFVSFHNSTFTEVKDINGSTDYSTLLSDKNVIIYLAARAHVLKECSRNQLQDYRHVNVEAALNLARQAASVGVKRFIYISSVGVFGSTSLRPFVQQDSINPLELSSITKWEAELELWEFQRKTGMEVVVIRPPLVYGPNAPGNFGNMVRWIEKGIPLPLGAIHNKRSLVSLDNLVDLIITCIDHPAAANQVFLAGDGQDLSTTELLRGVAKAMGKPARLFPVSPVLLMFAASLLGKKKMAQRLLGSLQVDISHTCETLGWKPPISVEEGLRRCFDNKSDKR